MTLIVCLQTRNRLLIASDAIVSSNNRPRFDRFNKCIVVVTRDSIGMLAFTGQAVINGKNTDDFLAGVICGDPRIDSQVVRFGQGKANIGPHSSGLTYWRVKNTLNELCNSQGFAGLEIVYSGIKFKVGGFIPFLKILKSDRAGLYLGGRPTARRNTLPGSYCLYVPGGWMTDAGSIKWFNAFADDWRYRHEQDLGAEQENQSLISYFDKMSGAYKTIGNTILFTEINLRSLGISTFVVSPAEVSYSFGNVLPETINASVAYSPWLIKPTMYVSPLIFNHTFSCNIGKYGEQNIVATFHGPSQEKQPKAFISSPLDRGRL